VINCFHCRIRPEGLLYDAERDLLAIPKFLVRSVNRSGVNVHFALDRPSFHVSLVMGTQLSMWNEPKHQVLYI